MVWSFIIGGLATLKLAADFFGSQRNEVNLHQSYDYGLERKLDSLQKTVREQSAQIYSLVDLFNDQSKLINSLIVINTMLMIMMSALVAGFAYYVFKSSKKKQIQYCYDSEIEDVPRKSRKPRNLKLE